MKQLNLNGEITVRLNEYGFERTQEIIQEVQEYPLISEKGKKQRIKLIESQIDENGCLTAPLIEVLRQYDYTCFRTPTAIVHELEQNLNDSKGRSF